MVHSTTPYAIYAQYLSTMIGGVRRRMAAEAVRLLDELRGWTRAWYRATSVTWQAEARRDKRRKGCNCIFWTMLQVLLELECAMPQVRWKTNAMSLLPCLSSDPQWSSMLCHSPAGGRADRVVLQVGSSAQWSSSPRAALQLPPPFAGGIRLNELRMTCDCMSTREISGHLSSQFAEP